MTQCLIYLAKVEIYGLGLRNLIELWSMGKKGEDKGGV
jgi:hypothetical protein